MGAGSLGEMSMTIVTIGIVGITTVLLSNQLKAVKNEYAVYLAAAAGSLIFFYGLTKMSVILDAMRRIRELVQINPVYLTTLLKMTGVTYISEFSAGICKDAGYGALAGQIEIFGKLSILALSMPIVLALLETLQGFFAG
jgi:stage III sporulation protein AD